MQSIRAAYTLPALLFMTSFAHAAEPAGRTFSIDLNDGRVPASQRVMKVVKNDTVRIRASSDASGELHLHGYRLEAKVAPGAPSELTFRATATGRFALEWHGNGVAPKTGGHHGTPLASLEVHPR